MTSRPQLLGDRYEVGGLLGHGGMAEVYLGKDRRLGRSVAIKVLKQELARDETFLARFQQEAQSAAGLNHPSIVSVYDTGEGDVTDTAGEIHPVPYIIMEYVEGQTLREIIHSDGGLPVRECSEIMAGVLSALDYSHRMGIVHRDIKPANIMLTKDGAVKVMDFGIARALDGSAVSVTQTQAIVGTANYFSPEQAKGEVVDTRSDLYSASCVMFELLTGRAPFVGDSPIAVAYQHVREQPTPPSAFNVNVSEPLDRVVLKGLAKHRDDRYGSAREFALDLRAAVNGHTVAAPAVAAADLSSTATQAIPEASIMAHGALVDDATRASTPAAAVVGGRQSTFTDLVARSDGSLPEEETQVPPKRTNRAAIAMLLVAFVVLAGAALVWAYSNQMLPFQTKTVAVAQYNAQNPKTYAEVATQLSAEGLVPQRRDMASASVALGNVISLDPQGGTEVPLGSPVIVNVSSGPPPPDSVTVPDVAGKTLDEVRTLLSDNQLTLGAITIEDSTTVAAGSAIRTDPAAGATAKAGDQIAVVVASGNIKVPDVTTLSQADAQKTLQDLGFSPKVVTQETTETTAGIVMSQTPEKDSTLPRGGSVTITVAKAPTQVQLKDYRDTDVAVAEAELKALGLNPVLDPVLSDTVGVGTVISTDPGGGNSVAVGATVTVTFANGPANTTVPEVVGKTQAEAASIMESMGLKANFADQREASDTVPVDSVIRVDPAAGSTVPVNSDITLYLSSGPADPAPSTTPPSERDDSIDSGVGGIDVTSTPPNPTDPTPPGSPSAGGASGVQSPKVTAH
ncbi:Stk1 family PASTA domain-containing Ser/Thr kinase [Micrococcales bacterium 31B]|nr:Stk1 family PASTA domain-containing Ser/Thr kinase [Micrococcales bacterium 31B]